MTSSLVIALAAEEIWDACPCFKLACHYLSTPGLTIDRQCGSGINAVALAAQGILAGSGQIYVAGGTESMTRSPYLLEPPSLAFDRMPPKFVRRQLSPDHIGDPPMGITAENLAEHYEVSREEQDEFALRSQKRMNFAIQNGYFRDEIVPVPVKGRKGETVLFEVDEHPRADTTIEGLAKLKPVFREVGSVTAGNSSGVNDGASALVMMSDREAERRGLELVATVTSWAVAGVDPNIMGIGPRQPKNYCIKRDIT